MSPSDVSHRANAYDAASASEAGAIQHPVLEVLREVVRIGHLDMPVGDWPAAVTSWPAEAMGLGCGRVQVGAVADLVLFSARDYSELLSRPQSDRVVRPVGVGVPSYRELDGLMPAA